MMIKKLIGATAPDAIAALNRQVVDAVNDPAVNKRMTDFGGETTRWHKLIRDLKITLG